MREHAKSALGTSAPVKLAGKVGAGVGSGRASNFQSVHWLLLLIAIPGVAWSQECAPFPSRQENPYAIRVDVGLVVLHATVENRRGKPVLGLSQEDFQVYEDGVLQKIEFFRYEDIPVTVGLIVDNSGSIRPKRSEVVTAVLAFARSSNPADQMFVVNFNEHVSFGLPGDTPFTAQAAQLSVALSRDKADGMTALYDAVAAGLEHLDRGNRDKKALIVISDGADNASRRDLPQVMTMAARSDAIIYTIGLFLAEDPDRSPGVLKRLAKATGGKAFLPRSVTDILPICRRIAHEIRTQYTLAYVPAKGKRDGSYRTVEVKARRPGGGRLSVRTRSGYYAIPPEPQAPTGSESRHEVPY